MIKHLFILVLFFISQDLSAHYIWIEAMPEGKAGEKQAVKIYYGEYENNRREEAGKRLEEARGLIAWILNPSGEKISLDLVKKDDHFLTEFTPVKTGRYEILVMNKEREVVDWSAYDIGVVRPIYYSKHVFYANDAAKRSRPEFISAKSALDLDLLPVYKNAPLSNYFNSGVAVNLNVFYKGSELSKAKLLVYAPSGWMKELERGEDELFTFTPLEKGQYIVECIYKEKLPGTFKDKSYEAIRHRTVLTIQVK